MGSRKIFTSVVLMATLLLSGCYHATYVTAAEPNGEVKEGGNSFFFFGLAGTGEVNVNQECPNGASKVDVYQTFFDGFLGMLTLGIYTPRSYEVHCASGGGNEGAPATYSQLTLIENASH